MKSRWVLVEHHGSSADRSVVEDAGVLELTSEEAANMNRQMVRSDCRVYPASWFQRYETTE